MSGASSQHGDNIIEERLLEMAKSQPNGICNDDIKQHMPNVSLPKITAVINKCLKNGYFSIVWTKYIDFSFQMFFCRSFVLFKTQDNLYYKYKDPTTKTVAKGADTEEKVVYKIIEEAGNKGIWIRDIRCKSNMNMTQLNKVLKSLETKKIIKAVKSVSVSRY